MRHRNRKKIKHGYDKSRRLERSLVSALILHEKIRLIGSIAKIIRSVAERYITKGKKQDLASKRYLFSRLPKNAARRIFEVLGPKYSDRNGGYTRMIRIAKNKDGSNQVILELV